MGWFALSLTEQGIKKTSLGFPWRSVNAEMNSVMTALMQPACFGRRAAAGSRVWCRLPNVLETCRGPASRKATLPFLRGGLHAAPAPEAPLGWFAVAGG